jgi:hypothetical protein
MYKSVVLLSYKSKRLGQASISLVKLIISFWYLHNKEDVFTLVYSLAEIYP